MLWYRAWLETRWRFVIGLVLLICSAVGFVLVYPAVLRRLPLASAMGVSGMNGVIGEQIKEAVELASEYRGYVWWQWFRQNLPQTWTVFAALLGTGGLLAQTTGGGALFTLSMPVSRTRLLGVRAATGLTELLVLAIVPALVVPLVSPVIGQSYSVTDALVHSLCLFIAGSVFFSLAFLLSTVFADVWRPALIVIVIATVWGFAEQVSNDLSRYGIFRVMTAQAYFRTGEVPWAGLFICAAVSAAMCYAAVVNMARRDF
jgi:ABC-2 type transport system permease protein